MSVAMMVPASLPAARYVAVNTLRGKRAASIALFLGGYIGIWAILAAVASTIRVVGEKQINDGAMPIGPLPIVLSLAAVWQVTPMKRTAIRACHLGPMLPVLGWRAATACVTFGLNYGTRCVGSCWLLMVAMYSVRDWIPVWMIVISAVIWIERTQPRSRSLFRATATGLAGLALASLML
jgi:predicted metal-binding membrane protein